MKQQLDIKQIIANIESVPGYKELINWKYFSLQEGRYGGKIFDKEGNAVGEYFEKKDQWELDLIKLIGYHVREVIKGYPLGGWFNPLASCVGQEREGLVFLGAKRTGQSPWYTYNYYWRTEDRKIIEFSGHGNDELYDYYHSILYIGDQVFTGELYKEIMSKVN